MADKVQNRERIIVRTSILGIIANVFLAGFKAAIGALTNSIAVTLDAVNNLSDALSSVITIVGAKLSGRAPDKKHPLGHGRVEYLSSMIIAALVLYAGITSMVESIKKIIHPETPAYTTVSLIILAAGIAVKLALGLYVQRTGKKVHSGSLLASGKDAMFDAILSASVLLSAIIFMALGIKLEAYVGVVIAALIIKSGIEMLLDALNEILGKRMDRDYLAGIRKTICADPDVRGAFDLILHSYGEEKYIGSVHVEVLDTMTAEQIDRMERRIADSVYAEHGVLLAGIGIYAASTRDETAAIRTDVTRRVMQHDGVLQLHGFFADPQEKRMQFDVILDFALDDRHAAFAAIREDICAAYPDYDVQMTLDLDV